MRSTIRLEGQWQFYADEEKQYTGFPPSSDVFKDSIQLPGTTAQAGKGKPNEKREDGCLTERFPYLGNAWYRCSVPIPEEVRGKRMILFLERTRVTTVWANGVRIGTQNSLCTPHEYDLTEFSCAEVLELTVCVDNSAYPTKGGHMTSPDTQTNWNGITGELSLRFYDDNCVTFVKAIPDAENRSVTLRFRTKGRINMLRAEGEWFGIEGKIRDIAAQVLSLDHAEDGTSFVTMKFADDAPLWDEYSPVVGRLRLHPFGSHDVTEVLFGLKDFRVSGMQFISHGRPVFLRGKHDGMIFPIEGAAPTDLASWLRVMQIAKSYGINHYRFHTCCPPEAAFTAADLLGIYMEPEIPFWGSIHAPGDNDYSPEEQNFLIAEGRRILETFGNHPSFCMFSLGNELWGSPERMGEILRYYKQHEERILMTQGCNNFQFMPNILPEDDYFVGVRFSKERLIRGSYAACDQPYGHVQTDRPSTMHSYDAMILPGSVEVEDSEYGDASQEIEIQYGTGVKKVRMDGKAGGLIPDKPVISHEIGQYVTYPNFNEIEKYIGVLEARNFQIFRERLEKAGMLDKAEKFFRCSGKLAAQCYQEEVEAAMRSEYLSGFQLLDIQDFSGQGTALVGILDAFMEPKGTISQEEWTGFCSDSVILGCFEDYCLTDHLEMELKLRHYAPEGIHEPLKCTITRGRKVLEAGELDIDVDGQGLFDIGEIELDLPPASVVHQIKVTLELGKAKKCYTLWQFPQRDMPKLYPHNDIYITERIADARIALMQGQNVLLLPQEFRRKIKGFYCADFWCYPMFRKISADMGKELPIGTLGLCIENDHPAIRSFRAEEWTTPPWYDIVSHSNVAALDGTDIQPIVQMIDNFECNHKLGILFECKVGAGKLLVCTARLNEISDRPEVRIFARSLVHYVSSPEFDPKATLSPEQLQRILS